MSQMTEPVDLKAATERHITALRELNTLSQSANDGYALPVLESLDDVRALVAEIGGLRAENKLLEGMVDRAADKLGASSGDCPPDAPVCSSDGTGAPVYCIPCWRSWLEATAR